jgi:hypothetical protein
LALRKEQAVRRESTLDCSPKMRHGGIRHFSLNGECHERKKTV